VAAAGGHDHRYALRGARPARALGRLSCAHLTRRRASRR
jgi:hypothetical protein